MQWIRSIQRKGGSKEADLLIRKYYDEIYIYVYKQTGSKETAMDLTQEIFISVLRSIRGYDSWKASFRTWLYRIAFNKIVDFRRSRVFKAARMTDQVSSDIPSNQDLAWEVERRELANAVEAYVGGLSGNYREIFRLRFCEDYSLPEITAMLGEPEATIKTRYYRLLKNLRKEFCDEYSNAE